MLLVCHLCVGTGPGAVFDGFVKGVPGSKSSQGGAGRVSPLFIASDKEVREAPHANTLSLPGLTAPWLMG